MSERSTLAQDQPQYDESKYPERVREYEQAKKDQKAAEEEYAKELAIYNEEKAKYDFELAKWEKESKAAQLEYETKLKEFNDKFFTDYGITYENYTKQVEAAELSERQKQEKLAKQEADRNALLKPFDEKIAALEAEKKQLLSDAHASVWGVGGSRDRTELNAKQNKIIKQYKSKIAAVEAEKIKKVHLYDFGVAYPDTILGGSIRDAFYASNGQKSLVALKESFDRNKAAKLEYDKQTSIQSARIDALQAAQSYAKDVSAYAGSIQNFTQNKPTIDPFVMQNPSAEFSERLSKIQDTKLPVPTVAALSQKYDKEGFKLPLLTQSQNRPTAVGVKFEMVESKITKPTEIKSYFIAGKEYQSTPEIDAIVKLSVRTPSKLDESIYLGVLEDKGIKPTAEGKELISLFKSSNVGYSPLERKAVYTDPKTGETFNAATMEGSYKIGKALGFQYDQNMYLPTYVTSETIETVPLFSLSDFEVAKIPINQNDKKQKLIDAALEKTLNVLDVEGQKKDKVTETYPSTIIKGAVIEGSKDILAGIGFASNVMHEYVETINLRGEPKPIYLRREEIDYKNAYAFLGSAGKVLAENIASQSTIQFDKPMVESMQIPPTLINTAIEDPSATPAYVEKYGAGSIIGAVGSIGLGVKPSKESFNAVKIKFKQFFKITDDVPVINPVTQKIYPEIRLQKPLTIKDVNMASEKPVEVLFTKQSVDLGKAKVTAPIKEVYRVSPIEENFARWDQPAKLPKTGQAPYNALDYSVSLADKAGAVPNIISHKPFINKRVAPVPTNYTRWDQPAKLPKTGTAPIKPETFDFTISLPDKAEFVPKQIPNTPIINKNISPVGVDYTPESQNLFKLKTGQAPYNALDYSVSLADKAGAVPKVVPNTPLITDKVTTPTSFNAARWNVPSKLPKTGKAPFVPSSFQSDTQKLIRKMQSGQAPNIAPVKFKLEELPQRDYLDNMLTKRSTLQKMVVPEGEQIPSFKELQSKAAVLNLKDKPIPVRKLTVSSAPMGIRWDAGKKFAWGFSTKSNAAPFKAKTASTDLTRKIPKTGQAPSILWSWKPKEIPTPTHDTWLAGLPTKRSSKPLKTLPKGVDEETVFTPIDDIDPTKMKFKEDPYEKWMKQQKKSKNPLDNLGNEFKENKYTKTQKPDVTQPETKSDDIENLQKGTGKTIQVMKPESKSPPKKRQRLDEPDVFAPESSSVSSSSYEEPLNITGKRSPISVLPISQSKSLIDVSVSTVSVSKTAVTPLNVYSSRISQRESSKLNIDVSPKIETKTSTDVFSKSATKERQSEKTRQRSRESEILKSMQEVTPKQKPRQVQKPRYAFRTPERSPTKQSPRLDIYQPFKEKTVEVFKPKTPERNKTRRVIAYGDGKKRNRIVGKKSGKIKEFIGNMSEVKVEGVYNRADTIYGKKRVRKLSRKDLKVYAPKGSKVTRII